MLRGGTPTSPVTTVQYSAERPAQGDSRAPSRPLRRGAAGDLDHHRARQFPGPGGYHLLRGQRPAGHAQLDLSQRPRPDAHPRALRLERKPAGLGYPGHQRGQRHQPTANFTNTIFDDNATTPIQNGGAPFFATFNPQMPLVGLRGDERPGDLGAGGPRTTRRPDGTGTINSWSLSFQKPVPTSGLGVPGADNINASFRIFNLGQANAMSAEAWTPVGPASISGPGARHHGPERRAPRRPLGPGHRRGGRSVRPDRQHRLRGRRQRRRLEDDRLPDDQPRRPDLDPAHRLRAQQRGQHRQHHRLPPE